MLILAACGDDADDTTNGGTDNGDTGADNGSEDLEPVTYHYFVGASGDDVHSNETYIGGLLEEETGVNFQMEYLVGDLMERLGVMVAGGEYPDVLIPDHGMEMILDAQAFIPLNDLLEEHGQTILQHYDEYLDRITMPDGNIYIIPFAPTINEHIPDPNINQGAFWIQHDVIREAGYPEVTNIDDYFDLITAYADENPEINGATTIPFTGLAYDTSWFAFSNIPNHLAGYPNDGGVQVDMETFEASVYADSDAAYEWLLKLSEMNAEGYVDQELFVMNNDDFLAKLSSGRVLGFFAYGWQFGAARNALLDAGNPGHEFMPLPVVLNDSITDQYLDPPAFTQNRGVGITTAAENPERIIQYWDRLVQEDMQKLVMWGEEGTHYYEEDGRFMRTEEQIELMRDTDMRDEFGMTLYEWNWPRLNGTFSDGNAVESGRQPEVAAMAYRPHEVEFLEAYGATTYAELFADPQDRPWFPAWSANVQQGSDVALFDERAQETTRRFYPQLVLGSPDEFDATWDDFQETFRNLDHLEAYEAFFTGTVNARIDGDWGYTGDQ